MPNIFVLIKIYLTCDVIKINYYLSCFKSSVLLDYPLVFIFIWVFNCVSLLEA